MDYINKVVLEEIEELPDELKIKDKDEYVCYILRSTKARARTYCGTTNDIIRRIRQHNGVITGGARATSTSQPWRIAGIVYGFSSKSKALRFEWFMKCKHSKDVYKQAMDKGANSIQRRAALLSAAISKCEGENLKFYFKDEYFRDCCKNPKDLEKDRSLMSELLDINKGDCIVDYSHSKD